MLFYHVVNFPDYGKIRFYFLVNLRLNILWAVLTILDLDGAMPYYRGWLQPEKYRIDPFEVFLKPVSRHCTGVVPLESELPRKENEKCLNVMI